MTRASDQGAGAVGQHGAHGGDSRRCGTRPRNSSGFANFAEYSLATKMARDPGRGARVPAPARARDAGRPPQREFAELEAFAGTAARGLGRRVPFGAAQARATRGLRRRAAPVLPAAARARRAVRRRAAAVRHPHRAARRRRGLSPGRRGSTTSSTPTARAAAASSSTCTRARRSAAARGWTNASAGSDCGDTHGAAGRVPGLQLHAAGRRRGRRC